MAYIKQDFIEKLLDRAHIDEVINKLLPADKQLKRAGAQFKAKSPFGEDRTASFMVSTAKNIWKDFSTGKGGKLVNFVMEHESLTYPEAIEKIAAICNMQVEYEVVEFTVQKIEQLAQKDKLRKVLTLVHELYKTEFKNLPEDHPAKIEVYQHRQYNDETVLDWGIGYAPENFLHDKLKASGYIKEGEDLGLIVRKWDKYSNRVVYPIHDVNGLLIGLAGRDVSGKDNTAKWINPTVDAANILYNKSKVWYGYHQAKMFIRKRGEAFVTEGYNDVIGFQNFGLDNTVASCGTSVTPLQINELKKQTTKVVFAFDPDKAGKVAMLKQIPLFIKEGFRTEVLNLDVDPDDFTRKHADEIKQAEGLENMFSVPGIRQDGFALLVQEYIKKDFYELEIALAEEKEKLVNYQVNHNSALEKLNKERATSEGDLLEVNAKLKTIELEFNKKSDEYKEQSLTVTTVKTTLDLIKHKIKNYVKSAEFLIQEKLVKKIQDDFNEAYEASEIKRATGAKSLCSEIINVEDKALFEIYLNWIQKESGVSKTAINAWIKEFRSENEVVEVYEYADYDYELPKEVTIPFKEIEEDVKMYGLFMANSKIYFVRGGDKEGKKTFASMSNFEIEILQHMADEKFPAVLVRMKNVLGHETIFDCPSETFNSLMRFKDVLSRHYNFIFKGRNEHLEQLHSYLFNKMGKGVKIDVPGFQLDSKCYILNNLIITYEGELKQIDENGRYIHGDIHYYIPAANKIYAQNPYKYMQDKNFKFIKNEIPFFDFVSQAAKVHRHHYISPLLYGLASLFRDFIVSKLNSFPILFLYGQGGTGKDELGRMIMSLTGIPQKPISLEAEISTQKATMRLFAKFRNAVMMLSEYKRGNQKQDGALKGIYDNIGYSIGTIESKFSTDYIPIESGLILTGNEFPDSEPLLQRLIFNQMDKNVFTQKEKDEMSIHLEQLEKSMSQYAVEFLRHRKLVEEKFLDEYSKWSAILTPIFPDVKVRIVNNLSVIAAIYGIFSDIFQFPFTKFEMIDHFKIGVEQQMYRINSTSMMSKFWDCFITSFRGAPENRIQANKIVSIEGTSLFIQWTHVYKHVQQQWFMSHREGAPKKEIILEEIRKDSSLYVGYKSEHSFDTGRKALRSSAVVINITALDSQVKNDIIGAYMEQIYSETLFGESAQADLEKLYDKEEPKGIPFEQIDEN